MRYTNIPAAHTAVSYCKELGIQQVILSPGSRNAPLIQGFAGDPYFECFSIVDERSAGFFALGLSQQSGKPSVLVCTSGSALLNYYPAVAEAYYSRIPLLIISADRPWYRIDIGDGQTIRQAGVLGSHVALSETLRQDISHSRDRIRWNRGEAPDSTRAAHSMQLEVQRENEETIARAIHCATKEQRPVHLNIPLEEPLYGSVVEPPVAITSFINKGFVIGNLNDGPRKSAIAPRTDQTVSTELEDAWKQAARKIVLIGTLPPGSLGETVVRYLAADPSILVLCETTSNLHHTSFFPSIDSLMAPLEIGPPPGLAFEALRPDVLLTLGGMVVSKKVKHFLRKYPPKGHWHIGPFDGNDTFHVLRGTVHADPDAFLSDFLLRFKPVGEPAYRPDWEKFKEVYRQKRCDYIRKSPFSDFTAFHEIFKSIPPGYQVQLSNSSTVRYAQLFDMRPDNPVFCNRGTSGIEGSTSTAAGAAWNFEGPSVLLSGDLAFLYDANGLWNRYIRGDFRIIVINNGGGGIFRILPGNKTDNNFTTYFETVHSHSMEALCKHFGIDYSCAENHDELCEALGKLYSGGDRPRLLEIRTPRELNDKILLGYFEYLSWSKGGQSIENQPQDE